MLNNVYFNFYNKDYYVIFGKIKLMQDLYLGEIINYW